MRRTRASASRSRARYLLLPAPRRRRLPPQRVGVGALGLGRLSDAAQLVALRRERVVRPAHAFARVAPRSASSSSRSERAAAPLDLGLERSAALLELRRARVGGLRVARVALSARRSGRGRRLAEGGELGGARRHS